MASAWPPVASRHQAALTRGSFRPDPEGEMTNDRPYRLAASAEILFPELPFVERVRRLHDLGYTVEFWDWQNKDIDAVARVGAEIRFTGHLSGSLVEPEEAREYVRGAIASLEPATILGCRHLALHTTAIAEGGRVLEPRWESTGRMWLTAYRTLMELAEIAERNDVWYNLENLNTKLDHPGSPLSRPRDIIDLVGAVNSPRIRILLDLYHAQVDGGDLIQTISDAQPWLGEIQVADVPGRHEPGTGEIRFEAIAAELRRIGFDGVVGLEAWPEGDSLRALERFSAVL
jgi:hydroxypyruvate isomerase